MECLLALQLKDHGFTQVDALDPNTEMLKQAEAKGAYTNLIQAYLGPHQTSIPNGRPPSRITDVVFIHSPNGFLFRYL